jgi:hemoglobin-like flavoprotein
VRSLPLGIAEVRFRFCLACRGTIRSPLALISLGILRTFRACWRTAMTPDQKRLVRETWKQAALTAEEAADLFYRRLFEIDPTTRDLFRTTNMFAQREKLLQTLGFAVSSLDNVDILVPTLEDLGRRHASYGVTDTQYDSMGAALLWTLKQRLGRAWSPAAASAWNEAYGLLAALMRAAAER